MGNIIYSDSIKKKILGEAVGSQIFQGAIEKLEGIVRKAIEMAKFDDKGHAFIILPKEARVLVSSGCELLSTPHEKKSVLHREEMVTVMDRDSVKSRPAESVAAIVYTHDACQADDQIPVEHKQECDVGDFYWVDILGFFGPPPPVSAHRFVRNLAGGNNQWDLPEADDAPGNREMLEKIKVECGKITEYEQTYMVLG
jgi:hypothetical protein